MVPDGEVKNQPIQFSRKAFFFYNLSKSTNSYTSPLDQHVTLTQPQVCVRGTLHQEVPVYGPIMSLAAVLEGFTGRMGSTRRRYQRYASDVVGWNQRFETGWR